MMIERRISKLEDQLTPTRPPSEAERAWADQLNGSAWLQTVDGMAAILASLRHAHGRGIVSPHVHVDDWRSLTTAEERAELARTEKMRLAWSIQAGIDHDDAVAQWLAVAADESWPRLAGPTFTIDAGGFDQTYARRRGSFDQARGADIPGAALWRREHPGWRPGMTGDEAIAFDLGTFD